MSTRTPTTTTAPTSPDEAATKSKSSSSQPEPISAADLALLGDEGSPIDRSPLSERGSSLLSEPMELDLGPFDSDRLTPPVLSSLRVSPVDPTTPVADVPMTDTGAAAPSQGLGEADASSQKNVGAVAPKQEKCEQTKLTKTNVMALRAAAVQVAAVASTTQEPLLSRKRGRLTLQTHHTLPDETPPGFSHFLINAHPWGHLVSPRSVPLPTNPDCVTSFPPPTFYAPFGGGGYLSNKFVRSLFPRRFKESPSPATPLPIFELMRMGHAVEFRHSSQTVIDELLSGRYVAQENNLPTTPDNEMPSEVLPASRPHFPVLYQVVSRGPGQAVTLEAKDFLIPGPDRRELHLIKLDQFATNVRSRTRGFDRALVSVKDFVWVYSVEPTPAALRQPQETLTQARVPRATVLDNRAPFFFRVKEFVFVTPPPTDTRAYGIILSVITRFDRVKGLRIAFEGAPEAVAVSPTICDFPISSVAQDEIVWALTRCNVSTAMRFSADPASKEARMALCAEARRFLPAHPDEGLLPLKVYRLSEDQKEWINDRSGPFRNYTNNVYQAHRRMTQLFNAACSALSAIVSINDDRRTHNLIATVPSLQAFPAHFDFSLPDMSSECGWTNQRPVYLWVVGSQSLIRATILQSTHIYEGRTLSIRLVVPSWQHATAMLAIRTFGTSSGDTASVPICVKLGSPPAGADPVYELISSLQLYQGLSRINKRRASEVMDTVYGSLRTPMGPVGPSQETITISVSGRTFQLRPDQVAALHMGQMNFPVLALQAAFGTGKTVMGALIAGRIYSTHGLTVIATTTTNTAVAQFTETLRRLDEFKNLEILRYVSDSALTDGTPRTDVDLPTILMGLCDNYTHRLDDNLLDLCRRYQRGRRLLETYLFHPERALHLTEEEREEYRLAERDVSDLTKDVIAIMFAVRKPAVVCLTTSALLNALSPGGIFNGYLCDVKTVIGDEASQIPEPAMVAIAIRLPDARHIYIGDTHQLEPHVRCPRNSNPAKFGAQGVMDLLLAKGVPTAYLTTTFRAHPELNALPNEVFYDQQLVSGTTAEERQMFLSAVRCPNSKVPFVFVDVPGTSKRALSGSHFNEEEATVCRQIIRALLGKKIPPASLAIIVFYREQFRLLEPFAKSTGVDIHTVDSVQGREKDIVVLLSTKTVSDPESGEFIDDPRRLNVALTRCRHGQFVLGHAESLKHLHYWRQVIEWAHHRGATASAAALHTLLH